MKIESMCRVCLSEGLLQPLFTTKCSTNGVNITCLEMLKFCINNSIDKEDNFPKHICTNCVSKLLITYKFKLLYEESYSKMIAYFTNQKTEGNSESMIEDSIDNKIVCGLDEKTGNINHSICTTDDVFGISNEFSISDDAFKDLKEVNCFAGEEPADRQYDDQEDHFINSDGPGSCDSIPPKDSSNFRSKKRKKTAGKKEKPKKGYFCEICQKSFKDETRHKAKLHSEPGAVKCERCSAVFQKPYSLLLHQRRHDNDLPCKCPHPGCSKAYPIPSLLRQHAKSHTDDRPFICQYCSHAARSKQQLVIHIRYHHTKEKCYKCSFCEKAFVSYQALYNHEKRHRNIKNHHCTQCERTFVSSSGLVSHMVTHTGEKKFECRLCAARFSRKAHRNKHEASVHAAVPTPEVTPSCNAKKKKSKEDQPPT